MASTIADADTTIWGVHAGKTGDADTLFLKHGCVAIGWSGMGDLSKLKPDRETFKAKVAETYPDSKPGAIPTNGGQIFRFVHEMKPGDLVVYPSNGVGASTLSNLEVSAQGHVSSTEELFPPSAASRPPSVRD